MSESLEQEIRILRTSFWSSRDPDGRAFAPLADAYRRKGELDEAHLLIQDGLGRHPDFATGHLIAARVAQDRGDLVEARGHFDRVLDLDDRNVLALIERAEAATSEGDREGALQDLTTALRLEPGNLEARERLEALERGPAWEPESATIPEVQIPDSESSILTRTMGDLYARQGFRERAIEVYEHLSSEDPESEELTNRLAELRAPSEEPLERTEESLGGLEGAPEPQAAHDVDDGEIALTGETQLISSYFEDLLAWVPGAVQIESLAPGAPAPEAPSSPEEDAKVSEPVSTNAAEEDSDESDEEDEDGLDEFNLWLKGLQS